MNKRFPIIHTNEYIDWDIIEPHRKRAYLNHSQILEMLAERGGLDWYEILCVLLDKPLFGGIPLKTGFDYKPYVMKAIDKLKKRRVILGG